jgi:hypothetical protein
LLWPFQKLRQLNDVGCYPPRFVAGEKVAAARRWPSPQKQMVGTFQSVCGGSSNSLSLAVNAAIARFAIALPAGTDPLIPGSSRASSLRTPKPTLRQP